jgi:hypothetical protein
MNPNIKMTTDIKHGPPFWLVLLAACMLFAGRGYAQYLGVTCGYQYSAQLTGPLTYPNQFNISLYNPQGGSQYNTNNPTWAT